MPLTEQRRPACTRRDSLDAALLLPRIVARQIGDQALSAQCRACPVRAVYEGGLYSHRYRESTGFYNPSVYYLDLLALNSHIREWPRVLAQEMAGVLDVWQREPVPDDALVLAQRLADRHLAQWHEDNG